MKGAHYYADADIDELYRWFAGEAASSPIWERMCLWIADTPRLNRRLDALPGNKRQPNLFLGALRYFDAPLKPGPELIDWVETHWDQVESLILSRATQTNEPGRCATLAPVLASLGERIALIEVGMSAGLCLFPDLYGYRWIDESGHEVTAGDTSVSVLECRVRGHAPVAYAVPNVVWRAGIDLNPLDPADPDDARWLEALVWPGQPERSHRLRACLKATAGRPMLRVRGDAIENLAEVVESAPTDATVVVMHSAVLAYFQREDRQRFAELVNQLPVRWLANEGERVLPRVADRIPEQDREGLAMSFLMSLDGVPLARTGSHGQFLHWFDHGHAHGMLGS